MLVRIDDTGSDEELPMVDDVNDSTNDSITENCDDYNDENEQENATKHKTEDKVVKSKKRLSKSERQQENNKFQKFFNEHRHLFDMSCDRCAKTFESLNEARAHHLADHDNPKGYIKSKSGKRKMFFPNDVLHHIALHLDPDKFKYASVNIFVIANELEFLFFQMCDM